MAEKTERSGDPKGAGHGHGPQGLKCVGAICYNPDTGKLEVELKRGSCRPSVIKDIIEGVVKGVPVEFVLPKPTGQE